MIQPNTPWYRDFFSGPVLDVVRNLFPPEVTAAEVEFIATRLAEPSNGATADKSAATLAKGAKILDVPCGAGRHALALAARGYDITGVDLSPELVAEAEGTARSRELPASFVARDMRDLPWNAAFDAAYCFGNSFAYMDDAGNADFLAAVCRALHPRGRFLLETHLAAESIFSAPLRRTWYPFGDIVMLHDTRYDPAAGTLTSEYGFVRDGRIERRTACYRIYLYREIVELCRRAGFDMIGSSGTLAGGPFAIGSPALYLLCRRA